MAVGDTHSAGDKVVHWCIAAELGRFAAGTAGLGSSPP